MNASIQARKTGNSERWRSWARSLAGQAPARQRRPIAMALVRRTRAATLVAQRTVVHQHIAGDRSILMRPEIHLALHASSPVERILLRAVTLKTLSVPVAAALQQPAWNTPARREMSLVHRSALRIEEHAMRVLAKEIVQRSRRVEERISVRTKFIQRGATSDGAPQRMQTGARPDGPEWWKAEPARHAPRQAAMPAMNMDQITETVLRQLDHRVGAWRERMGRM